MYYSTQSLTIVPLAPDGCEDNIKGYIFDCSCKLYDHWNYHIIIGWP